MLRTMLNVIGAIGLTFLTDMGLTKLADLINIGGWYRLFLMEYKLLAIGLLIVWFSAWFRLLNKSH